VKATKRAGKTREALAGLLMDRGYALDPDNIARGTPPMGGRHEAYAWDVYCYAEGDSRREGPLRYFYSWDTMTDCVKHGIVIEEETPFCFLVSADVK
jgi:hypothetical protein